MITREQGTKIIHSIDDWVYIWSAPIFPDTKLRPIMINVL